MTILGPVKRESISEAYKKGLVKPNELQRLVDGLIDKEIYLRDKAKDESYSSLNYFEKILYTKENINIGIIGSEPKNLRRDILATAQRGDYDNLLLSLSEAKMLALAEIVRLQALCVRELGDINRANVVSEGGFIYADKRTIRSLDQLLTYQQCVWDLLNQVKNYK